MLGMGVDALTVARSAHEAARALAISLDHPDPPLTWDKAPDWERGWMLGEVVDALNGVVARERWVVLQRDRLKHGWRHGDVLHGGRKTDPRLTTQYEDQPLYYLLRDALIDGVADSLAPWMPR